MKILQSWDDGVIDDVRVIEILRKYNAKGTFNLNPGLYKTERTFGWMHEDKEVWRLGTGEMRELYDGFEIASHSMTHPFLTNCTDYELIYEIIESRKFLQNFFKQDITGFCYPFGNFDDRIKGFMREAGYTHARGIKDADNKFPIADVYEFNPHCHFALNNRDYLCGISRDITQSKNQQKAVKEREKEIAIQMKKNGIPEDIIESCTGIPKSIIKDLDVLGEYI